MSSRLLTMKFMQRAAASGPQSAPVTPESRPSKRPRLSEPVNRIADQERIQEALAAEELKRQLALDRQAADAGDTKWELDLLQTPGTNSLNVISAGYTVIDSPRTRNTAPEDDEEEVVPEIEAGTIGRRSFGRFNKVIEVRYGQNSWVPWCD